MKVVRAVILGFEFTLMMPAPLAPTDATSGDRQERTRHRLALSKKPLDLSDDQAGKMQPIMEGSALSGPATLQRGDASVRYGVTPGFMGYTQFVIQLERTWQFLRGPWKREKQIYAGRIDAPPADLVGAS